MEFLSLNRRRSSVQNIPSGKEQGETDVFAGYNKSCVRLSIAGLWNFLEPSANDTLLSTGPYIKPY